MGADDTKRLRFQRRARLRTGYDFRRVREQGARMAQGCLVLNWLRLPPGSHSRLGVVSSARLGGAVQRNRARRLLRECYRRHQHELGAPVDLVLVARPSINGKKFAEVEKEFLTSMRKTRLLK
jgi:ribonuclease P protein component